MRNPFAPIVLSALLALALGACGGAAPASPAAPTSAPAPTNTPAPTSTPAPTNTPAPDPNADPQKTVMDGLELARTAQTYRMTLSMKAKGDLGESFPNADPSQEIELLNMEGDIDGKNSRIVLKGFLAAFFGAEGDQGVEFMTVDGANYIHGPIPLLSAPEDKWYLLPANGGSPSSAFGSDQLLNSFASEKMDLSDFKIEGAEELDGRQCTIVAGDKDATIKAFQSINTEDSAGLPSPKELKDVKRADLRFWVCDDGYFHKMVLDFEGIPEGQTEDIMVRLEMRLFDFDGDIKIEAPADAVPIPTPSA